MTDEIPEMILYVIFSAVFTIAVVWKNIHILRHPESIEKGSEEFLNKWIHDTPEVRQKRLEAYQRSARIWLVVAVIPFGFFLLSSFSLVVALWSLWRG
jgi:hypothetical protein